jgi:hypothetical protein
VWQFDQGYNFAKAPTSVIIEGPAAHTMARRAASDLPFRTTVKTFAL